MLDLSQLDLSQFPDKPEGSDRLVSVIVIDRPDPAGADADMTPLAATTGAYLSAVCDELGTTLDQVHLVTLSVDIENTGMVNGAEFASEPDPEG